MSGLVNGVLAGTGAFEIATALTLNGELQQRDFFGVASNDETDPSSFRNGFGGVWRSWRG